jgi:anti-sigma B factor antagonist
MTGIPDADDDPAVAPPVRIAEALDSDGTAVLRITGELDLFTVEPVRDVVRRVIDDGATAIVFDLTGVLFMDSSGIAMLLVSAQQVPNVTVRGASSNVRRVIEATGLAETLRMT